MSNIEVSQLGLRISKDVHRAFRTFCKANGLKMETVVEHLISELLTRHQVRTGKQEYKRLATSVKRS